MAFIDGSVVSVSLPVLQRQLSASVSTAQWVVEAYSLFLSTLVLVGGALADRYGRRRLFLIGTIVFAAASLACGLAALATARWLTDAGVFVMLAAFIAFGAYGRSIDRRWTAHLRATHAA